MCLKCFYVCLRKSEHLWSKRWNAMVSLPPPTRILASCLHVRRVSCRQQHVLRYYFIRFCGEIFLYCTAQDSHTRHGLIGRVVRVPVRLLGGEMRRLQLVDALASHPLRNSRACAKVLQLSSMCFFSLSLSLLPSARAIRSPDFLKGKAPEEKRKLWHGRVVQLISCGVKGAYTSIQTAC